MKLTNENINELKAMIKEQKEYIKVNFCWLGKIDENKTPMENINNYVFSDEYDVVEGFIFLLLNRNNGLAYKDEYHKIIEIIEENDLRDLQHTLLHEIEYFLNEGV